MGNQRISKPDFRLSEVPRGWLRTAAGIFSLDNSDRYCGSYISLSDAARILRVEQSALQHLPSVRSGTNVYISDQKLGRAWASGTIQSPRGSFRHTGGSTSFDELIILTIIELALPGAHVETQVRVGRRVADFRISHGGKSAVVEFLGPYHFIRRTLDQKMIDPRERASYIEDVLGEECIIWPYWVQRCASNARAIFDPAIQGIGSIWSTSAHFGDFFFADSSNLIQTINRRFRLERHEGIGYFYTDELAAKPVHPIIRRIRTGRDPIRRLIPPGPITDPKYWLPKSLWSMII